MMGLREAALAGQSAAVLALMDDSAVPGCCFLLSPFLKGRTQFVSSAPLLTMTWAQLFVFQITPVSVAKLLVYAPPLATRTRLSGPRSLALNCTCFMCALFLLFGCYFFTLSNWHHLCAQLEMP